MCSNYSWMKYFTIAFIFVICKQVQSFCPSTCICSGESNLKTSCVNADLAEVPIQLNPGAKYMNLTSNKIRNVDFALHFYTQLEILDLSQNIIETLGSKNFEFQKELRTLNLSYNDITILAKKAFKGLENLLLLDLSYNRIEIMHSTSLQDLRNLTELNLCHNYIVSLEENVFRNMILLEILILKNNQLMDVPTNNLQNLKSLKTLDLSVNIIESVRNSSFDGLKNLIKLDLSGNVISDIDVGAFNDLVKLKRLDIGDNNLTVVPTLQLSKLSNLTHLSLSGNRFSHIPGVAFFNLFRLKELYLERLDHLSKIDSKAFVDNTYLQKIFLNNNQNFSDLPRHLFHGNPNLIEISIQGNNLRTIDAVHFPIDQIHTLYLGDNPLECNCSLLWLWRLVAVRSTNEMRLKLSKKLYNNNYDNQYTNNDGYNNLRSSNNTNNTLSIENIGSSNFLLLDSDRIGCEVLVSSEDQLRVRKLLRNMDETEISCPAHVITIVCAILSSVVVTMTGASILFYLRIIKRKRKLLHDRRNGKSAVNTHDRIPQQHQDNQQLNLDHRHLQHSISSSPSQQNSSSLIVNDKLELERYLAAQAITNNYRALKPWELQIKETFNEQTRHHYEKFDHYEYPDTQSMPKPHIAYV